MILRKTNTMFKFFILTFYAVMIGLLTIGCFLLVGIGLWMMIPLFVIAIVWGVADVVVFLDEERSCQ